METENKKREEESETVDKVDETSSVTLEVQDIELGHSTEVKQIA